MVKLSWNIYKSDRNTHLQLQHTSVYVPARPITLSTKKSRDLMQLCAITPVCHNTLLVDFFCGKSFAATNTLEIQSSSHENVDLNHRESYCCIISFVAKDILVANNPPPPAPLLFSCQPFCIQPLHHVGFLYKAVVVAVKLLAITYLFMWRFFCSLLSYTPLISLSFKGGGRSLIIITNLLVVLQSPLKALHFCLQAFLVLLQSLVVNKTNDCQSRIYHHLNFLQVHKVCILVNNPHSKPAFKSKNLITNICM